MRRTRHLALGLLVLLAAVASAVTAQPARARVEFDEAKISAEKLVTAIDVKRAS